MKSIFSFLEKTEADRMKKRYVYLPFVQNECSEEFVQRVQKFRDKYPCDEESENKQYEFLIYGHKKISKLPKGAIIYIAGYGLNAFSENLNPEILKHIPETEHIYSISGGKKAITMDTLVKRMMLDGLARSKIATIKLWFGDCNNKAGLIADEFIRCLGDSQHAFRIDYYPHANLSPLSTHGGEKHKWAKNTKTQERTRASQIRESIFFNMDPPVLDKKAEQEKEKTDTLDTFMDMFGLSSA